MKQPSRKKRERRNVGWIWLLFLCTLLSLHFWFPEFGTGAMDDTYSSSGSGKKAFFLLLEYETNYTERNRVPLSMLNQSLDYNDTLCILGPARYPSPLEWSILLDWVNEGGRLIISASDKHPELEIDPLEISVSYLDETERENIPLDNIEKQKNKESRITFSFDDKHSLLAGKATTVFPDAKSIIWETNAQVNSKSGQTLISLGETKQAVRLKHGFGDIVVAASSDIFSNQSMIDGGSVAAFRLIESAGMLDYVVVDESLNASGTSKVVALLINPTFRPLTIQILIALLLYGWWHSIRFGPFLSSHILARHNIVSHTDNVGNLHFKNGNAHALFRAYVKQLFTELHLRHFRGEEHRVIDPIARRLKQDPEKVKALLMKAAKLSNSKSITRHQMGSLIRKLSKIRRAAQPGR
ncbi:DUF4350 domain-containing protein [Gimesia aquarii]|uniref:DUF4350 domain-containing protein n=1 Tax=Gimesia aquarii TaxID=2527964 RepID=A0A517WPN3_9PLAN|nr:DUF4350 domain-containing protein [Gimesia aquarii]QDU07213.1 hypothetical protein V202x_05640 [Gimesia aquarii]